MTNLNATTYKTIGDVPLDVIIDLLDAADSPMIEMVAETHRAAQPHTALFWSQAWLENKWETTGHVITPADHNPVSLRPWESDPTASITGDIIDWQTRQKVGTIRVPPGAVGAIRASDGSMMLRFATDAAGAREWRRRLFDDANYKGGVYRNAVTLDQMLDIYAPAGDVHPVTGVDNADIGYADAVRTMLAKFARLEGNAPTTTPAPEPTGDTNVPTYTTTVPGLPGGPLVTDYPINIKLIPASRTYQRPGIKAAKPRRSVQHGTGNPASMAASEISWLVDSQAGGGQVSFHSTADDFGVWVGVPADEVTWQAADGGGPGNMNGFSCEMIENSVMWASPTRRARAIYVTADWMGKVAARLGIAIPEQHWTFNYALPPSQRHDCPDKLRHVPGAWDAYVKQWNASKAAELKRMEGDGTGGDTEEPTPIPVVYATPSPIPALAGVTMDMHDVATSVVTRDGGDDFIFVADVVEATQTTPRLQFANYEAAKDDPKQWVGPVIEEGERFIVTWLIKAADGEWYYITPYWTRVLRKHTKRIADAPVLVAAAGQDDDLPEAA